MARKRRGGHVLKWYAELLEVLMSEQPLNQTSIVATAGALLSHANPDGTRCRPGMRRVAVETGQHRDTVARAMVWLIENGWLTLVRRVAHGGREFNLTFSQRPTDTDADNPVSVPMARTLEPTQRPGQRPGQRPNHTAEPSTFRKEGVEGGGTGDAKASPSQNGNLNEEKKLIVEWLVRWQHLAESFNLDPDQLDIENPDLVNEYRRLHRWDWGDLKTAIPIPKQIKTSVTGWFLAALRKLPADPVDNTKVAEDRIDNLIMDLSDPDPAFRKALKQASTRAEKAAVLVWELDEYETVLALAKQHGYQDDNGWTQKGRIALYRAREEYTREEVVG